MSPQFDNTHVIGPLFDGTDLLTIVEELLDLRPGQDKCRADMVGNKDRYVDRLILIDIARSLRKIASAPALCSTYRSNSPRSSSGYSF